MDARVKRVWITAGMRWSDLLEKIRKENIDLKEEVADSLQVYPNNENFQGDQAINAMYELVGKKAGKYGQDPVVILVFDPITKRQRLSAAIHAGITRKPDSERLTRLLPETTRLVGENLHLVNHDYSMLSLLSVHWENFDRRTVVEVKPCTGEIRIRVSFSGARIKIPLLDEVVGTGKSEFGEKYLAMVERFKRQVASGYESLPKEIKRMKVTQLIRSAQGPSQLLEHIRFRIFLDELKAARTLHVKLKKGSLSSRDHHIVLQRCAEQIVECIAESFGVAIEASNNLSVLFESLPKPIFIFLDDIGAAIASRRFSVVEQRAIFLEFCRTFGMPLTREPEMYLLVTGDAELVRDPPCHYPCPAEFACINLCSMR